MSYVKLIPHFNNLESQDHATLNVKNKCNITYEISYNRAWGWRIRRTGSTVYEHASSILNLLIILREKSITHEDVMKSTEMNNKKFTIIDGGRA